MSDRTMLYGQIFAACMDLMEHHGQSINDIHRLLALIEDMLRDPTGLRTWPTK